MPREYGTPIGIPGGPSERPSGDRGRRKPAPASMERVRAELAKSPKKSEPVKKRVRGSSATASKQRGSMPMLDRIIDEESQ